MTAPQAGADADGVTGAAPVRILVTTAGRITLVVALLLTAYLVIPVHRDSAVTGAVLAAVVLSILALAGIFIHQTWRIGRSPYPLLVGAEALIIVLASFLIGFAFVYLVMSSNAPDTFSEPLNRTGALYFAITVLSTVGFGDITPRSDPSRWLVSAQMLIDIGFLAGALRLILGIARRADQKQHPDTVHPGGDR